MRDLKSILGDSSFKDISPENRILEIVNDRKSYENNLKLLSEIYLSDEIKTKELMQNRAFIEYCLSQIYNPFNKRTEAFFYAIRYNKDTQYITELFNDIYKIIEVSDYPKYIRYIDLLRLNLGSTSVQDKITKILNLKEMAIKRTDKEFLKLL